MFVPGKEFVVPVYNRIKDNHVLTFSFRIREKSMGTQTKIADTDERDARNEAVVHIEVAAIPHAEQESSHVPN